MDKQWIDVSDKNIYTLSNNGEFTKVNKLLRRKENSNIYHVITKSGNELKATSDHITILDDGTELKVSELKIGDKLPISKYSIFNNKTKTDSSDILDKNDINYGNIVSIEQEPYNDWVYDFETENHLFVANGIVTHNCLQVDLQKTFKDGFKIGSSYIREPQSIRSAASLACIVLQSSQNNMFGGQSIQDFDRAMAEGVRRSFKKEFEECSKNLAMVSDVSEDTVNDILKQKQDEYPTYNNDKNIDKLTNDKSLNQLFKNAYKLACKRVEEETHQAMESVIFNLNSMHSRAGQVRA